MKAGPIAASRNQRMTLAAVDSAPLSDRTNAGSRSTRVVVKRALKHNAVAVAVVHNHPSGHTRPSTIDKQITQQLKTVLALVDIQLLDHFVIGKGEPFSFAAASLL